MTEITTEETPVLDLDGDGFPDIDVSPDFEVPENADDIIPFGDGPDEDEYEDEEPALPEDYEE